MSESRIWVLTDRRYSRQRMPGAVIEWLSRRAPPAVVVADEPGPPSRLTSERPGGSAWAGLRPGDVVVARSRDPLAIALLEEAEALGARSYVRSSSLLRVRDKVTCTRALEKRGLPVPETYLVRRPEDLRGVPAKLFPLLLKPVAGDNARGLRLVPDPDALASVSWTDDFMLAQRYVDSGGVDLKLYAAGESVWAIRRASPIGNGEDRPTPVPVTPVLRDLVAACREEFDLPLLGIDVLESGDGPVIVDVNEFPNYTGIGEAPAVIGKLLMGEARRTAERIRAVHG